MSGSGWQQLFDVFEKTEDPTLRMQLFEALTTEKERKSLAIRAEVAKALLSGKESQREISKRLDICIATVTRGSQNLKTLGETNRAILESLFLDDA